MYVFVCLPCALTNVGIEICSFSVGYMTMFTLLCSSNVIFMIPDCVVAQRMVRPLPRNTKNGHYYRVVEYVSG